MLIYLILPIYMSNKPLFQYYHFLVPLKMNAISMSMTNMFVVQKFLILQKSPTDSYKHSCKQT